MCCISCFRPLKKSWKCWKGRPSKEDGSTRKRKQAGFMCGLCGGSTKDEGRLPNVEESSKSKGCMSCYNCDKSTKDAKDEEPTRMRLKCRMGCFVCGESSEDKEPLRREEKDVCDKPSKDENPSRTCGRCGKGCCTCDKSSKDEELPENKGESGTGCFGCDKSSKYEELSGKKGKCGMGCFARGKSSMDEESSRKKGKCGMACFCCRWSRNEGNPSQKGGQYGNCFKGNKLSSEEDPSRKQEEGCMSCFYCCGSRNKNANKPRRKMLCWKRKENGGLNHLTSLVKTVSFHAGSSKTRSQSEEALHIGNGSFKARVFAYNDIAEATQNFAPQNLLGAGELGQIYKGQLKSTNQMIGIKKLHRNEYQSNREFIVEVLMLSALNHENLVNMLGYCAEGDERILVFEYMPNSSLRNNLFDLSPDRKPLDWETRLKIAAGAARGLEHLHDAADPPVIYGDLNASNILLDEHYNPRLADFGLAKLVPFGHKNHVPTSVMAALGYCAPEYASSGKLTAMSDIYSFGVILLELVTGRKAMDSTRPRNEQRLVDWVMPRYQDRKNFVQLADPLLEGSFPIKSLYQTLAVAAMCLQEEDTTRPRIKDVLFALQFLAMPEKTTIPNKLPAEPPKESYSTSTDEWQSCSDQEQEEEKRIYQPANVR